MNPSLTMFTGWFLYIQHNSVFYQYNFHNAHLAMTSGGAVAQSVERATPGGEVPGSIPAVAARSLLVGSVSV